MQNTHPELHPEGLWRMVTPMDDDDCAHNIVPFTNKRTDTRWARRTLTGPCFFPINYGNKAPNGHKVNYKTHCASRLSFVLCLHSNRSKKIGPVYPSDARMSKMDVRMFDLTPLFMCLFGTFAHPKMCLGYAWQT